MLAFERNLAAAFSAGDIDTHGGRLIAIDCAEAQRLSEGCRLAGRQMAPTPRSEPSSDSSDIMQILVGSAFACSGIGRESLLLAEDTAPGGWFLPKSTFPDVAMVLGYTV